MKWHQWLFRNTRRAMAVPSRGFRPSLEALEDRTLPANTFLPLPASTGVTVTPPNVDTPGSVVSGDFNGDGRLDLAVASATNGNISIMINNGRGSFTPGPTLSTGGVTPAGTELELAAGNFNGDSITDLAFINTNTGVLGNFISSNGALPTTPSNTRNLTAAGDVFAGGAVTSIVAGNVDGAGLDDFVVGGFNGIGGTVVLFTNVSGNFTNQTPVATSSGGDPIEMALGNLSGTTFSGLVVANSTGTVSVLLGNATGTNFNVGTLLNPFAGAATAVETANLRGIGVDDIVVTNFAGNSVGVLLNNGAGVFRATGTDVTLGAAQGFAFNGPNDIKAADFSGDGKEDLAIANSGTRTVSVLISTGTGTTFTQPTGSPYAASVGTAISGMVLGGFTGTGRVDIAVGGTTPAVQVIQNQVPRIFFAVGSGTGAAPSISIYDEKGTFLFSFNPLTNGAFTGGIRVAVGDVNGDGQDDLAFCTGPGGNTFFALLDSNALFTAFSTFGNNPTALSNALIPQEVGQNFFPSAFNGGAFITIGSFDGNRRRGEVVLGADAGGGSQVSMFSVNPTTLVATQTGLPSFYAFPNQPGVNVFTGGVRIASGDVNGDGLDDLVAVAGFGGGSQVNVYLGTANGSFLLLVNGGANTSVGTVPSFYATGNSLFSFGYFPAVADFNGDGKADLIFGLNQTSSQVSGFDANKVLNGTAATSVPQPSFFALQGSGGSSYAGGVRIGSTLIVDPTTNNGEVIQSLLTVLGPPGSQLTDFDLFSSFTAPAGTLPRVVLGPIVPLPTTGNGYYISG